MENYQLSRQQKIVLFVVCALFSLAFYGLKAKLSFQPDIYRGLTLKETSQIRDAFSSNLGRPVASLLSILIGKLPMTYDGGRYYLFLFEDMFFMAFACYRFGKLFFHKLVQYRESVLGIGRVIWLGSLSFVTLGNLFSAEPLLYPGLHYFLSIWLCVEAVIAFVSFADKPQIQSLLITFLCLYLVSGIYQTNVSLFVILGTLFVLLDVTGVAEFVKKMFLVGGIYLVVMLPQVILLKTIFRVPKATVSTESRTIVKAAENYTPSGVSPKAFILQRIPYGLWFFAILCILLGVFLVYSVLKTKEYVELAKGTFLACTVLVMGLLPYIAKVGGDYKPRVYYPLATMFGVLMLYGEAKGYTGISAEQEKTGMICIGMLSLMLIVQWRSFLDIYTTQYLTDREDQYISEMIGEAIRSYEEENNEEIRFVTFYDDSERTKYIENKGWCLSERAYDASWSRLPVLNYWLNEDYQSGEVDTELAEYYSSNNWNTFSEKQICFIGDCAHICVY